MKPHIISIKVDELNTIVTTKCIHCSNDTKLNVLTSQWEKYKKGVKAQDAFLTLNRDQRELIISGMCPVCWLEVMGA